MIASENSNYWLATCGNGFVTVDRFKPCQDTRIKVRRNIMSTRKAIFPANPHALYKKHGYSPAILSGDLLFASGMVGARKDGTPEPDLEAQVQLAFQNLNEVLAAAKCTFDDIVDLTFFLVDPDASMGLVLSAMKKAFPVEPLPNATAIGVNWLAGFQVEIKVIARVPGSGQAE